ncbi:MAG TPA: hypothetical protein VGF16_01725 [Bryobacteraceae bacterium]
MCNRKSERGAAAIEFTLSTMFLVPLLLGTLVFGFRLIRAIEMDQITRDLGHMYARGFVDFRNPGPIQNAQTLASGFDLTNTGTSVVELSQIKIIQQSDCDAVNGFANSPCPNKDRPVFTEQLTIGNTSAGTSRFGTPPTTNGSVTPANQINAAGAVANGFSSVMTLPVGVTAYVAEMNNQTPDLNIPGFSGMPLVYARAIF